MVAEQPGPQGNCDPFTHSFEGEPQIRTQHSTQVLFHGPVIYVADVYALIDAATSKYERMLLSLFAKATQYRDMREYRFAIWAETEPSEEQELLTASAAMVGSMGRESYDGGPQIVPPIESLEAEKEEVQEEDYFDNDYYDEPDQWIPSLNRSQGEIYMCLAGKISSGAAGQVCGASLKDGATSSLDFFPTVGQMGEKVADPFPYCGTGSQTQVGGCLSAHPAPDSFVGVEVWAVTGQVHQEQVQAGRGQISA